MKAMTQTGHGGPEVLDFREDLEDPTPGPGEVRVRVRASGVNHIDLVVRRGYPGIVIPMPHVPGGDIAGEIDSVGEGVGRNRIGERVVCHPTVACGDCVLCRRGQPLLCTGWQYFGLHRKGGYAERVVVPAQNALTLPGAVSFEQAAALPVAGLTALHALGVGELREGESFFLYGGAGALGAMAIQLAKHRGATVIATGSSPQRLELMRQLGADVVFDRGHQDVPAEVARRFPGGIDVVLDYVGPQTFPASFQMLRKGGRLLACGMITGRETTLPIHLLYLKHASVRGLYLGTVEELQQLLGLVAQGVVKPLIGATLPLREAARAQAMLERSEVPGKIVLVPDA